MVPGKEDALFNRRTGGSLKKKKERREDSEVLKKGDGAAEARRASLSPENESRRGWDSRTPKRQVEG